jgi:hypothetical protein
MVTIRQNFEGWFHAENGLTPSTVSQLLFPRW